MSDKSYLEIKGHFMAASKPTVYGTANKSLQKFYVTLQKGDQYETFAEFTCFDDKIELDRYHEGDEVTVRFNISSRVWTRPVDQKRMVFQSLNAFSMSFLHQEQTQNPKIEEQPPEPIVPEDDLPF